MMHNMNELQDLLHFDFTQMRAFNHQTTEEGLRYLYDTLIRFFTNNSITTVHELRICHNHMKAILERINQSEYQYFLNKYRQEYPEETDETRNKMAKCNQLTSLEKLSGLFKCWSTVNGEVRFKREHQIISSQIRGLNQKFKDAHQSEASPSLNP